ncbi:hypothetical protein Pmar_PMAR025574 [Perkinsus marinus ATCC 50983]|uniref:Uncharacterized protein n=1 Tax=Perkinsus marinus (strain ATCC 50983 / TXsc) TaxID=423536 RepID=C5LZF3_PERM5|nr:hypothetical protein Pmar_PMAR025574 [Perkinsus marinus ATCC 50983]EEQ97947.1 hypothetical protein Pmar_PMAR025574 [Perkinsus marinus ATCC 50983]|eukprot:XP_002765230.1 hypothetical protein Pmar_PMAR025574 [Perkinsus marinus ATCC 50983]
MILPSPYQLCHPLPRLTTTTTTTTTKITTVINTRLEGWMLNSITAKYPTTGIVNNDTIYCLIKAKIKRRK